LIFSRKFACLLACLKLIQKFRGKENFSIHLDFSEELDGTLGIQEKIALSLNHNHLTNPPLLTSPQSFLIFLMINFQLKIFFYL